MRLTLQHEHLLDDVLPVLSHFYAPSEVSIRYNHVYRYMHTSIHIGLTLSLLDIHMYICIYMYWYISSSPFTLNCSTTCFQCSPISPRRPRRATNSLDRQRMSLSLY